MNRVPPSVAQTPPVDIAVRVVLGRPASTRAKCRCSSLRASASAKFALRAPAHAQMRRAAGCSCGRKGRVSGQLGQVSNASETRCKRCSDGSPSLAICMPRDLIPPDVSAASSGSSTAVGQLRARSHCSACRPDSRSRASWRCRSTEGKSCAVDGLGVCVCV
jgi:hypothetical protein